jgi:hypothetical protein
MMDHCPALSSPTVQRLLSLGWTPRLATALDWQS